MSVYFLVYKRSFFTNIYVRLINKTKFIHPVCAVVYDIEVYEEMKIDMETILTTGVKVPKFFPD